MSELLLRNPLFKGISPADLPHMLNCLKSKKQKYKKNSFIFMAGESVPKIGILLSGKAQVIKENYAGDRMIIDEISTSDIFGETFACMDIDAIPVSVIATEDCHVLLLDAKKIARTCCSACDFHHRLISNLLAVIAGKNALLSAKMSYITHKTIRSRLLAFLYDHAEKAQSERFSIPYNRNELADYLCTDRSALSRELSRMKREGIIDYDKNIFEFKSVVSRY